MSYKKLKPHKIEKEELEIKMRNQWKDVYCLCGIKTFDGIVVKFYEDMFDHCFYESRDRKHKDKSILSLNRLEKMLWIKDTLQDENAILKKGWDTQRKEYYKNRRVAVVKGNYVVIVMFTALLKAKFITAYEKNDIDNILNSPDFEKSEKYFGKN
ncbi:hypothetical protein [Tenacibaculum finnmarkense]|uniref:Uncharacterized protein n=3 Tax=Tenacibaculum finnmarkense TaxID=2781243 RepID=A0A2I2M886_9FLAO|nr:hypothetical protein [Tenacibaculum finnmarkense]MBE7632998.1 hypothetical protein [Tenacibaculum finnmarkense genomovar ulcerans]MBE7644649.1 hypothetical protein [Tenacibaculum finnmarkense genomovar ulcerans]MBE7651863.1 hypothetical protein [Tenacibaculum finnmarkense genomovar finnmarkense]MBE7694422.1 hypothetical protein [Tenacibaculum finnmarkense genomovar finnmarkense]MBE7697047.1 hypothetical protein [Tenacibaculum finnmarkense genomovar ulcerans]